MIPNKTERFLQVSIVLLLILLGGAIFDSMRDKIVGIGDRAPNFNIVTDNGRRISRSDFGGRLLVLNFWATWCPPCIEEMPSLDEFQRRLAASGVVVVGVSVDTDERAYREFLQKAKVSFLTARDPAAEISSEYGTFRFPETYIIDSRGRVVQKHIGPEVWTNENLIRGIQSLL
jgi:cytochrome c biogenesis protein CcmG, thiol:disulfide interchange protein DsbE